MTKYLTRLLLMLVSTLSIITVYSQRIMTVSGIVKDSLGSVANASVYIEGTSLNTISDSMGRYILRNIPLQHFRLIASYPSYETKTVDIFPKTETLHQDMWLLAKKESLEEVVISSDNKLNKKTKDNPAWMDIFLRAIFGDNALGRECSLQNKEAIHFHFDNRTGKLTASANATLIIRNNALGYMVYYDLKEFYFIAPAYHLSGSSYFKELDGSKRQKEKWEKKRNEVYQLSSLKFFRSLYQLQDIGSTYNICNLKKDTSDNYALSSYVRSARDLTYIDSGNVYLNLEQPFFVDLDLRANYSKQKLAINPTVLHRTQTGVTSLMTLFLPKEREDLAVTISPDGTIYPRESLHIKGFWGRNEIISNSLPADYVEK